MGTVGGVCEGGDTETDRSVRERLRDRDRHVVAVNITSRIKKVHVARYAQNKLGGWLLKLLQRCPASSLYCLGKKLDSLDNHRRHHRKDDTRLALKECEI